VAVIGALKRLDEIRVLDVGALDFSRIPPSRLAALARYAAMTWAATVARMPPDRRLATLLAFARVYEGIAQDDALDALDQLIATLLARVEHAGDQARLRTLRDLDAAALVLRNACRILRDPAVRAAAVRETVETTIGDRILDAAIDTVGDLTRAPHNHYYDDLLSRYSLVRQFLPTLLRTIHFEGTATAQPLLAGVAFLSKIEGQKRPKMGEAPQEMVSKAWQSLVVGADHQISRRAYTFAVLEGLQSNLRRHDVYVRPSERWGDARAKLLQGDAWTAVRAQVCRSLARTTDPAGELATWGAQLDTAYRRTADNLATNPAVRVAHVPGRQRDTLIITPLDRLDEPASLRALRTQVAGRLPHVDLPDVLLEIHAHTGFADEFTHISEHNARVATPGEAPFWSPWGTATGFWSCRRADSVTPRSPLCDQLNHA